MRVDALGISVEEKSRPNAVLLGTLCGLFPFLRADDVLAALTEEFAGKHPEAVAANERAFHRGGVGTRESSRAWAAPRGTCPSRAPSRSGATRPSRVGGILPNPGNTVWNDLSASRAGSIPVLRTEKCIHCGVCDLVCPDFCLVWADGEPGGAFERQLMGVDYRYCKGCLRCVESCPTGALAKEPETPGLADRLRVPLFPELIA